MNIGEGAVLDPPWLVHQIQSCMYNFPAPSRMTWVGIIHRNDFIHRTLSSAGIPSRLEPPGLSISDGKRPDGATLAPWSSGRPVVWDATCPDTFAPSHRSHATRSAGCVGEQAEGKKAEKYAAHLAPAYLFQLVAIETSGAIGSRSRAFLRELGRRVGVRLDRQATSSRDSLWPYSMGMLRLSWVVPPEPTPFINSVCCDLPCVYV